MKQNQLTRFGGTFAILLGIAKLFSSAIYVFLPPDLRAEVPAARFLPAFAQDSSLLITFFWIEALVGFLGVAVVPALSALVQNEEEGWVRWTSNLATSGFVVTAVGYTLSIAKLPGIAAAFAAGDPSTQAALGAVWKSSIDLFGLWGYGAVGLWVLVLNILFLRQSKFPQFLSYLGILLAILFLLVPIGTILKIQAVLLVAAGAGAIVGPVWWIWSGSILRSNSASS